MYVCICNQVTEQDFKQAVEAGATSMRELRKSLAVATCCGGCEEYSKQLLKVTMHELGAAAALQPA